jgi:S-adenosylmethionine synthetase
VAYAIGVAEPLSINVDTYGTGLIADDAKLEAVIRKVFDMTPAGIIRTLKLKHPKKNGWSYQDTAAYGHFGRKQFPWEKTDKVEQLKKAAAKHLKRR